MGTEVIFALPSTSTHAHTIVAITFNSAITLKFIVEELEVLDGEILYCKHALCNKDTTHMSLSPCSWAYRLDCARSWTASPPCVGDSVFTNSSASRAPESSSIAATVHAAMSRFFLV
jgi:hypothetical protein